MDTPAKAPTQLDIERADWKAEYDSRLSVLDPSSATDKQGFDDWLNGFRIKGALPSGSALPPA